MRIFLYNSCIFEQNMRMGDNMKKIIIRFLSVVMIFALFISMDITSYAESAKQGKTRAIYVVFDNSGSMYGPGNMAWSQATYAMEVFSAMMNFENGDTMKIFPMHEVTTNGNNGTDRTSSITIKSISDIQQIHNMYTPNPLGTPYTQVNVAANELAALMDSGTVQEGWLVVLTDGDFDSDVPSVGLQEDLVQKAQMKPNMFVQYLAMGKEITNAPDGNESKGFYAQKAGDSSAVINELAVISNRIFKRNEYKGYKKGAKIELDIPLSKLIVFAQGSKVKVNSLKNKEGSEVKMESNYEVSCSSTDGAGRTSYVTQTPTKDTSLKGVVTTFGDASSIMEGNYELDIEGADSILIYYEPNVKFGIELLHGNKKVEGETIEGGVCTAQVGFINQLSGKFIKESKLLGDPQYKLLVNGQEYGVGGGKGATQTVDIEVGGDTLELEASAVYLNDYVDVVKKTYKVCTLEMDVKAPSSIALKSIGETPEKLQIQVMKNGKPLTKEQCEKAMVDISTKDSEGNVFPIEWEIAPGNEVSSWTATPKYKDGDMFATGTGQADITISVATEIEGESYGRSQVVSLEIKDDKSIVDYLKKYWKEIVISLLLLILLLGYVPPFKKRFPRKMKHRPSIECTAEKIGIKDTMVRGTFEKNFLSRILPYKAEVGRLTFSPTPVKKTARLKAAGGGSMVILNTSSFAGKEDTTFNGMSIPDNYKGNYRMSASTIIVVTTPEFTYTCIPNVQRMADGTIKRGKGKKK